MTIEVIVGLLAVVNLGMLLKLYRMNEIVLDLEALVELLFENRVKVKVVKK